MMCVSVSVCWSLIVIVLCVVNRVRSGIRGPASGKESKKTGGKTGPHAEPRSCQMMHMSVIPVAIVPLQFLQVIGCTEIVLCTEKI